MSTVPASEIAYRLLRLEQQLESYQRLHAEELGEIHRILEDLKIQILALVPEKESEKSDGVIP